MIKGLSVLQIIPFRWMDQDGAITVLYTVNENPLRWGYGVLNLPHLLTVAAGFPVVYATVAYPGDGYTSIMAWIQIVRPGPVTDAYRDLLPQLTGTGAYTDLAPQLLSINMPFYSFGHRPAFFDAPSTTDTTARDWLAHTYLVASPDGPMTKNLQWLGGFRWSYRIQEGKPGLLPCETIDHHTWNADAVLLRQWYPDWNFFDARP